MSKLNKSQEFNYKSLKNTQLLQREIDDQIETWDLKMTDTVNNLLVDIIQTWTSDNNKWHEKNVVTDKVLHRFLFEKQMLALGLDKDKLANYIIKNFNEEIFKNNGGFDLQKFAGFAQQKKYMVISLPYGIREPMAPRKYMTDFWPAHVAIDGYDYSSLFECYDEFGPDIVNKIFESIVNKQIPHIKNDMFDKSKIDDLNQKLL